MNTQKDKKSIMELFRPTKLKIAAFVFLFMLIPFPMRFEINCDPFPCPPEKQNYVEWYNGGRILWEIADALRPAGYAKLMWFYIKDNWFFSLPTIILEYLLACAVCRVK
jgi:hypothetical protein